jgi:hypothetical protein
MEDWRLLSDYNVREGSDIRLVLRLRGMISTFEDGRRMDGETLSPTVQWLMLSDAERQRMPAPMDAIGRLAAQRQAIPGLGFDQATPFVDASVRNLLQSFMNYMYVVESARRQEEVQERGRLGEQPSYGNVQDLRLAFEPSQLGGDLFVQLVAAALKPLVPQSDHSQAGQGQTAEVAAKGIFDKLRNEWSQASGGQIDGAKIALRLSRGPTSACIDFHTDGGYASYTLQLALNDSDEYEGGRLVYFKRGVAPSTGVGDLAEGTLLPLEHRPAGSMVGHNRAVLHAVTAMHAGVRRILVVVDESNGLGEAGVVVVQKKHVDAFLAARDLL